MPDVESQSSGVTMDELTSTTQSPQLPQRVAIAADQQGEKYEDSSDGVWSMYLTEAKKQDRDVIESWKGDTEGILFFTGLFSATVALFIIESYKKLSPDSSDTTNALLTQITQQLVHISNGTPLTIVAVPGSQPFKPTASAVRVNVLFFLSLVLSLTCALSATLMQQWTRRYRELAQQTGAPYRRGRIRACIFHGIRRFGMARAIATMPLLLNISVFLFFAGLLDFLFPINKPVSYATLACVVVFALAYAVLTVSPILYFDCPYATPLSGPTWWLSQVFVIVGLKAALRIEDLLHNPLLKLWSRVNKRITGSSVHEWRESLKSQVKVHRQWLSDGVCKSIERRSKAAPSMAITAALEWTLTTLDEDEHFETFVARVPGFFDSHILDATPAILPLMSELTPTNGILGTRLYDLLKTCIPVAGTSLLDDEQRMNRLRVCLKCLCHFGRAYNQSGVSEPLPSYFPSTISSPKIIRSLQTEQDPIVRVMGRCFGALVLTKLTADVTSSTDSNVRIGEEQLVCLSAILGIKSGDVRHCISQRGVVQLASMVSLVLGDASTFLADNILPSDVLKLVQQTLYILSETFPAEETVGLPLDWPKTQIISGSEYDPIIVSRLGYVLRMCASGSWSLTNEARGSCLQMSLKSLWHYAKVYHQLDTSKSLPPHFLHILATPEITHHIHEKGDLTSRVIGYCFQALVVTKLAADLNLVDAHASNTELECLSAIFGAERHVVEIWLRIPGAIEHMSLFFLILSEAGTLNTPISPSSTLPKPTLTPTPMLTTLPHPTDRVPWSTWQVNCDPPDPPDPPVLPDPPIPPVPPLAPMHSPALSWTGDSEQSDLGDMVQQTFSILSLALPVERNTQPPRWLHQAGGKFQTTFQLWLCDLLETCTRAYGPPENEKRIGCLKSLWHHEIACHHLRAPGLLPPLGLLPTHFITPEIARRIHAEDDIAVCVIGRCFASLVANRLAAKSKPFTDDEVACISAIHCIGASAATYSTPGVVQLIGIVSLTFVDVNSLVADTVPPYVLHIVGQTISTLTQALSAELCIELQLNQADSWMNVPDSRIKSVIVSHLRGLFKVCTQRPFPLPEAVRTYCVQMCLYGLWCWVKVHRQLDASQPLPPEFLDLAGLDITSHIRTEKDQNTRVMGRCVEALVVINLVARIRSRTDSDSTIPLSDKESACISAILGTESHDLRLWLSQPGAVELATLVFSEIEVLFTDTLPSESIMPHMVEETCDIVYWQLPYELSAEMLESFDDLQRLTEPNHSPSRMCLKRLWQYAKVYNGLGISAPLPPFVPITLASPEFTQRLHAEGDLPTRVIGRCVQALIVNKLVDGFQSRISLSIGVDDAELASISSILGTEPDELLRWPLLSAVIDIKLQNVIFLMSGEIEDLFSPYGETPTDALHVVQQTLKVICSDPVLGGVFVSGDLPMNQVRLLREIYSNIANAYANRISVKEVHKILDELLPVEILGELQQLLKHMPTVERKIRRWTTTTFDPKSVRGLGNLTAQPEYEKRRRSWLV